ncbi:threonine/serine exporter family protein [Aliagarivorans taiwanensis]|uniref:threonine/serine exporter family protein n=1 Tax=Aliagarivorans taiwanensis TaxID=561966 RepID=UPI00047BBB58|nr:threonine/serine exporter family protein [Aliagarivorans taiwanensis]
MTLLMLFIKQAILAAIPAVGFAMLFHVPAKYLKFCAILGAFGYVCRSALLQLHMPIEWASLVAAMLIGLIAVYWSRKHLIPRPVMTVAAVIPMVPGSFAFKTILSLLALYNHGFDTQLLAEVLENGLKTLFILGALSFGLAVPSIIIYRNRPIV